MSFAKVTATTCPPEVLNRCFALVDCNNFYASCERVFNPRLRDRPVVVLSSNDGCIVARSNEAKALGIGMGKPFFQCRHIIEKHKVKVFSSNFPLYGDMSRRVMAVLARFAPEMEVYSIDEAFLDLCGCGRLDRHDNLTEYARTIRATVMQWTGIPVSVGIARTKTLAKAAAHLAKKSGKAKGVVNLIDTPFIDRTLENVKVGDVWGVGWRTRQWFLNRQITNARQLRDMDDKIIAGRMGIMGLRLVNELRGVSCFSLDTCPPSPKSILSSRSFGRKTSSPEEIRGAVATHITIAAEKLRAKRSAAKLLTVFLLIKHTGKKFNRDSHSSVISLPRATNNTPELIRYAIHETDRIYQNGGVYVKAGVMLNDIIPEHHVQTTLFSTGNVTSGRKLMEVVDRVNRDMGYKILQYAVQIPARSSRARRDHAHRRYTTSWEELTAVTAR